jgi:hypothetical protein
MNRARNAPVSLPPRPRRAEERERHSIEALGWGAATLVLTLVHHVYGAAIYDTPWRNDVAYIAVPALLAMVAAHLVHARAGGTVRTVAFWILVGLVLSVSGLLFGMVEGGFNHLVKNLLFFGGMDVATLERLYPPPTAELPNDFWFEATGILQFVTGLGAIRFALKAVRRPSPHPRVRGMRRRPPPALNRPGLGGE